MIIVITIYEHLVSPPFFVVGFFLCVFLARSVLHIFLVFCVVFNIYVCVFLLCCV